MLNILKELVKAIENGRAAAMATLIAVHGIITHSERRQAFGMLDPSDITRNTHIVLITEDRVTD